MVLPLLVATSLLATTTTFYPGFGDRGIVEPKVIENNPQVEMTRDLGPVIEMVVRCRSGAAIISYSKVERIFCPPKGGCQRDLRQVVTNACGGQ